MGRVLPVLHLAGWQVGTQTETTESGDAFVTGAKWRGLFWTLACEGATGESKLGQGFHL